MTNTERTIRTTLKTANPKIRKAIREMASKGDTAAILHLLSGAGYMSAALDINTALTEERAREDRLQAYHLECRTAHANNCCPTCGAKVRLNLSMTGWVQCSQYGAPGFRADSSKPACSWQGFTR